MHPQVSVVLQTLTERAIEDFRIEFYQGIKNRNHEVNLAHHLLIKIDQYLPSDTYDTDLEYNRMNSTNVKVNPRLPGTRVRPDILLHKRGIQTDNRLVIEMKRVGWGH